MEILQTCPILRSFDEALARDFYIRFLGFEEEFSHRFAPGLPLYLGLRLGGLRLHLSEHHGDASPGAKVFVRVTGLEGYLERITGRGHPNLRPGLESQPWGRELTLTDPFSNRLAFCEG
jgi:uncharacterized glyoxalase superfamily protein PhnB